MSISDVRNATVIRYVSTILLIIFISAFCAYYTNTVVEARSLLEPQENPAPPPNSGNSGLILETDGSEWKAGAYVNLDNIKSAISWIGNLFGSDSDNNDSNSDSMCGCGCGESNSSCDC